MTRASVRGMFAIFPSKHGPFALGWNAHGITDVFLPDSDDEALLRRVSQKTGEHGAPPAGIRKLAARVQKHLAGVPHIYDDVVIDLETLPPFHRKVYEALRAVPPGRTVTYAELAARAGSPLASRAVGQAMAKNPMPLIVPCQRVLAGAGKIGGFSAPGGVQTKTRLLADEGIWAPRALRDADFDLVAAQKHLLDRDPAFAEVIQRVPFALEPEPMHSPFAALARAIVFQQLNGKAATTIANRLHDKIGKRLLPEAVLAARDADLRGVGLSQNKMLALQDLARHTQKGTVPTYRELKQLRDDEIIERLTAVRGIGEWTVQMLLMFRLGRIDVLPATDLGVQKGFARVQGKTRLPSPEQLTKHAERWRPYRSLASWYCWRVLDMDATSEVPRQA